MRRQSVKTEMIHARVELHRGFPFPVSIPNEETLAAMKEANDSSSLKRYQSFHELRKQI